MVGAFERDYTRAIAAVIFEEFILDRQARGMHGPGPF